MLAPYVVRNLAAESQSTGDLSAELDVRAIDAKFGKELRAILPSVPTLLARRFGTGLLGRALGDGGRLIGEEAGKLLTDLDTLKLYLNVTDQVSLNVTASFRADTSFVARSSFGQPSGPAPALFWKGPADAASGSYTTLTDPAHYADVITTGKQLVVGLMTEGKIGSDAERKKVAAFNAPGIQKAMKEIGRAHV